MGRDGTAYEGQSEEEDAALWGFTTPETSSTRVATPYGGAWARRSCNKRKRSQLDGCRAPDDQLKETKRQHIGTALFLSALQVST